jgi:hypothetical protein
LEKEDNKGEPDRRVTNRKELSGRKNNFILF